MANKVLKSITSENTFTDPIHPVYQSIAFLNISIDGSAWAATVTLQRNFHDEAESVWHDVESWTGNTEAIVEEKEKDVEYRLGVKTGNYTSGTINVRLSR